MSLEAFAINRMRFWTTDPEVADAYVAVISAVVALVGNKDLIGI